MLSQLACFLSGIALPYSFFIEGFKNNSGKKTAVTYFRFPSIMFIEFMG